MDHPPHPEHQPGFRALDLNLVREGELVFGGGWMIRTRLVVPLLFDGKPGGFTQVLNGDDEFQGCGSWERRQPLPG